MKIITCYTVPIKQQLYMNGDKQIFRNISNSLMKQTSQVCLEALSFCTDVFLKEWDTLSEVKGKLRKTVAEQMIHGTSRNAAKYPGFDEQFPYMPSYMRRAVMADALGMVSSYMSNHKNWEALSPSERGDEPTLGLPDRYELTFYDQDRDLCDLEKGIIGLKLYDGDIDGSSTGRNSWNWYYFRIPTSDARHIHNLSKTRKLLSPVVEKIKGSYRIRFSFEEKKTLVQSEDPLSHRILAVDLGINSPASWSVMTSDGTVHARGVVRLRSDEDRLSRLMNRKRRDQQSGKRPKYIYRMVDAANKQLSIDTTREIMKVAVLYDVDCIVFEHLDRSGSIKGRRYKERIHMWRANDVQKRVELQAHRNGMRISRICAWNTSKLAYDGSGKVKRFKENHTLCRFKSMKIYNCDISASMNIGARYFLRALSKRENCPELPSTPRRTYATLMELNTKRIA